MDPRLTVPMPPFFAPHPNSEDIIDPFLDDYLDDDPFFGVPSPSGGMHGAPGSYGGFMSSSGGPPGLGPVTRNALGGTSTTGGGLSMNDFDSAQFSSPLPLSSPPGPLPASGAHLGGQAPSSYAFPTHTSSFGGVPAVAYGAPALLSSGPPTASHAAPARGAGKGAAALAAVAIADGRSAAAATRARRAVHEAADFDMPPGSAMDADAPMLQAQPSSAAAGGKRKRSSAVAASARIHAAIEFERDPRAATLRGPPVDPDDEEAAHEAGGRRAGHASAAAAASTATMGGGGDGPDMAALGRRSKLGGPGTAASSLVQAAAAEAAFRAEQATGGGDDDGDGPGGDDDGDDGSEGEEDEDGDAPAARRGGRKRKAAGADRLDRSSRERNREHARKSRLRKKFFVDSLKANLTTLEEENRRLRTFVQQSLGKGGEALKAELEGMFGSGSSAPTGGSVASSGGSMGGILGGAGDEAGAAASADPAAARKGTAGGTRASKPGNYGAPAAPAAAQQQQQQQAASSGAYSSASSTAAARQSLMGAPEEGDSQLVAPSGPGSAASFSSAAAAPAASAGGGDAGILAGAGTSPEETRFIDKTDYALVEALQRSQQNFVVSDPGLPDNPIVFASQGFYDLTGYTPAEVIGRNCRFLQGPDTDPEAIAVIRKGIAEGRDTAITLVNYKKDGSQFWNRFFVAPLRGVDGAIVNFVGVQCEVKDAVAQALVEQQQTLYPRLLGSQQVMPPLPPLPAPLAPAASAVAAAAPGPVQAAPVGAAGRTRRRG